MVSWLLLNGSLHFLLLALPPPPLLLLAVVVAVLAAPPPEPLSAPFPPSWNSRASIDLTLGSGEMLLSEEELEWLARRRLLRRDRK